MPTTAASRALPLDLTEHKSLYNEHIKCISNDSLTRMMPTTASPQALPLVFTEHKALYNEHIKCIFNNDSFTELLNEDTDSYVLNPWSWNRDGGDVESVTLVLLVSIAVITMVTNIMVVKTFVKYKMLSAINTVLIAIAVSDTCTVLIPSIANVYLAFDDHASMFVPFNYCRTWGYLTKYLPTITHNASVWLTVVLALDRYLAVKYPFLMRRLCVPRTSISVIVGVYIGAILGHLCRFIDTEYVPVNIVSVNSGNRTENSQNSTRSHNSESHVGSYDNCESASAIKTCRAVYAPFFRDFAAYEFLYYWFVILFVKFIPCTCLIILDTLMIRNLWRADHKRRDMTPGYSRSNLLHHKIKTNENRRITVIVIIVIVIVVIVELPIGVILIFWTLATIHGSEFISERTLSTLSKGANFVVYISYPIVFLMYCSISAKFRNSMCRCCCQGRCTNGRHGNAQLYELT